ncbi:MAG: hypothetical protein ACLUFN_06420 [Eubacterium sp.]
MIKEEFHKIFKSKKSNIALIILCIVVIVQSIDSIIYTYQGFYLDVHPAFISILTNENNVKYGAIFDWIMPIFLIISYCDKYITEKKLGILNVYLNKVGRRKFYFSKLFTAFLHPAILCGIPLLLNLCINTIFLHGGTKFFDLENYSIDIIGSYLYNCIRHPYITYFGYIISFIIVMGLLNVVCQSICIIFNDVKISYIIAIAVWLIYFADPVFSISDALQPFAVEYTLTTGLISIGYFFPVVLLFSVISYISFVVKKDEI